MVFFPVLLLFCICSVSSGNLHHAKTEVNFAPNDFGIGKGNADTQVNVGYDLIARDIDTGEDDADASELAIREVMDDPDMDIDVEASPNSNDANNYLGGEKRVASDHFRSRSNYVSNWLKDHQRKMGEPALIHHHGLVDPYGGYEASWIAMTKAWARLLHQM